MIVVNIEYNVKRRILKEIQKDDAEDAQKRTGQFFGDIFLFAKNKNTDSDCS